MRSIDALLLGHRLLMDNKIVGWRISLVDHAAVNFDVAIADLTPSDEAGQTAARCWIMQRVITVSKQVVELNDEAAIRLLLLHEIAHAMTPVPARGKSWHGREWKMNVKKIGGKATTHVVVHLPQSA